MQHKRQTPADKLTRMGACSGRGPRSRQTLALIGQFGGAGSVGYRLAHHGVDALGAR
jgi:hypothetical protein